MKDGSFKGVYCHSDGFPCHTGKLLVENYDTFEKIEELLAMGAILRLGHTITASVFFHRDRGERLELTRGFGTWLSLFEAQHCPHDYNYVWLDGSWYYFTWRYAGIMKEVKNEAQTR